MGFYATDQLKAVLESCQENLIPPSKNRVWDFFTTSETCAGFFESQPVEPHQEKWPTPTTTVSGVRYYGYRYYQPEIGRWASRDPLEELGGLNVYAFVANSPNSLIDLLGAKKVPYLWVSLVEREFEFVDIWDFIKFKWKWLDKIKDLLLLGDDVIDFLSKSTTLWVKTSETDVPDCYVVINDHAKDEIKSVFGWPGESSGPGGIISIYFQYLHVLEWEWGPPPGDPCCK